LKTKPELWSVEKLRSTEKDDLKLWVIPQVLDKVQHEFSSNPVVFPDIPETGLKRLAVVGGGVLIDTAKIWRAERSPQTQLIAVPSIWGSGAENSPIAVQNVNTGKDIHIGDEYLPDIRVVWADLVKDLPQKLILNACGDVWSHALEGFSSPLADAAAREELADVIKTLLDLPLGATNDWFELSARACRAQSQASVGLTHGIAHVLEHIVNEDYSTEYIGHASLCSVFMWPVFQFNMENSDKFGMTFRSYGIEPCHIEKKLHAIFDPDLFNHLFAFVENSWKLILRDPSTRTNAVLVKRDTISSLKHFTEK